MRRREFIAGLGVAAWPLVAGAQQSERTRQIGVLMSAAIETDQRTGVAVFVEGLHLLGWLEGRDVQIGLSVADQEVSRQV